MSVAYTGEESLGGQAMPHNPIGALFEGFRQVFIATLHLVATLVRFSSVTVPSTVYKYVFGDPQNNLLIL